MSLESILQKFASEMVKKGLVSSEEKALEMPRLDFAMLIMQTYVKYPLPVEQMMPYNYCALGRINPIFSPILSLIC